METPATRAGNATEHIMTIFWKGKNPITLSTEQYNRVYAHVLHVLETVCSALPAAQKEETP